MLIELTEEQKNYFVKFFNDIIEGNPTAIPQDVKNEGAEQFKYYLKAEILPINYRN